MITRSTRPPSVASAPRFVRPSNHLAAKPWRPGPDPLICIHTVHDYQT